MNKAEVHKYIETKVRPDANVLFKAHDAQTDKLREILFTLQAAEDKADEPSIRVNLRALGTEEAELADHLSRTGYLIKSIEGIDCDEGVLADYDEVTELTAKLSELKRKINKNYGIGKKAEDQASKVLAKHKDGEADSTAKWAVQEAWIRKHLEMAKKRLADIQQLSEKAKKAAADRNDKALEDTQKASAQLRDYKPTYQEVAASFAKFCETVKPKNMSKDLQDQFQRDRAAFQKLVDELQVTSNRILEFDAKIETVQTAGVDYKKAAALLKIPNQFIGRLEIILEGNISGMEKALDAFAKDIKLKISGKDMLATLKRAKLI